MKMERKDLMRVVKVLNKETELLEKVGEEKIPVVGKGTKLEDMQENFKKIMLALDDAELIDETPEDCIDFWEEYLEEFIGGGEEAPEEEEEKVEEEKVEEKEIEEEPEDKKKKKKKERTKKKETEKSRYGHKPGTQAALIDDLLHKGITLENASKDIGVTKSRVKNHIKHLEMKGYKVNEKDGIFKVSL